LKHTSLISNIFQLWAYLGKRRKLQFIFLFILMIISIFSEIISIGSVIPFLSALTNPNALMHNSFFQPMVRFLEIKSASDLLLPLTLGFVGASVFAAMIRILILWFNTRLSASMGIQLRTDVYSRTLHQSYEFHVSHNSSELISMVTEKVGAAIQSGILHVLMSITAFLASLSIAAALLIISPIVAILASCILGGGYLLIGLIVRKRIGIYGTISAKNQPKAIKCMQEGLGGIRDVILDNSYSVFTAAYHQAASKIQLSVMRISFLSLVPKSLLEVLAIALIAIMAYFMQEGQNVDILPVLGALALGAQRLLPNLQQIYFSWTNINSNRLVLSEVVSRIYQPLPVAAESSKELKFTDSIFLDALCFKYQGSDSYVLNNISLNISKGSKIGFIGETGSGKSTLLDLIMGLLCPSSGSMVIDGVKLNQTSIRDWQSNIAHVPQSIFLSDASVAENIAFGIPLDGIDMYKVEKSAKQSHIHEVIQGLPEGYHTHVGERGVQLSGGQRQRIAIARALYKKASVIVFDEATSALDNATELSVMQEVNLLGEDLTILIIAHRLSTLIGCDQIYKLKNGYIIGAGSYDEVINGLN